MIVSVCVAVKQLHSNPATFLSVSANVCLACTLISMHIVKLKMDGLVSTSHSVFIIFAVWSEIEKHWSRWRGDLLSMHMKWREMHSEREGELKDRRVRKD